MNRINYSKKCDEIIAELKDKVGRPRLLLHVCCAPCSSSVIESLESELDITLFFYNPNITVAEEFYYRLSELQRFVHERGGPVIPIITPSYDPSEFFDMARGLEAEKEGGIRCFGCYEQRLEKTAEAALEGGFDLFTTTLSVSPYKNARKLNDIGLELEGKYGVRYLVSDFKKKNGYLRSIELSSVYDLYRQDFCGCIYSKIESEARRNKLYVQD